MRWSEPRESYILMCPPTPFKVITEEYATFYWRWCNSEVKRKKLPHQPSKKGDQSAFQWCFLLRRASTREEEKKKTHCAVLKCTIDGDWERGVGGWGGGGGRGRGVHSKYSSSYGRAVPLHHRRRCAQRGRAATAVAATRVRPQGRVLAQRSPEFVLRRSDVPALIARGEAVGGGGGGGKGEEEQEEDTPVVRCCRLVRRTDIAWGHEQRGSSVQ